MPGKSSVGTAENSTNRMFAADSGTIEMPTMSDQHHDDTDAVAYS